MAALATTDFDAPSVNAALLALDSVSASDELKLHRVDNEGVVDAMSSAIEYARRLTFGENPGAEELDALRAVFFADGDLVILGHAERKVLRAAILAYQQRK